MLLKESIIKSVGFILVVSLADNVNSNPTPKNDTKIDDNPSSRIINGQDGSWSNYPSLVSLRVNGGHSCGGALLNANTVLTASHCSEVSPGSVSVWAYNGNNLQRRQWWDQGDGQWWDQDDGQGGWPGDGGQGGWPGDDGQGGWPGDDGQGESPGDGGEGDWTQEQGQGQDDGQQQTPGNGPDGPYTVHKVSQIIKHPNYISQGYIQYDVAIWKLATPVSNRVFYQIDTQNLGDRENSPTKFAGWGRVDPNDNYRLASKLQTANLPVYPFNTCNAAYQGLSKPHHLCAGYREGRSAVCQGDSGGPLVIDNTIIGVTSFVKDLRCLNPDFPSVFARVSTYAQWIQQYVR